MENYTKEQLLDTTLKIKVRLIKGKEKTENKKVVILGGQPGAGKTKLARIIRERKEDYAVISGDDYRREHPNYKELQKLYKDDAVLKTQKFAGEVTENLIKILSNEGYNLIIEGTLRTKEVPLKTEKLLKEKGYETELSVIATKPELSYLGTLKRYEDMLEVGTIPRSTPKEHHDLVVNGILKNIELIYLENKFDEITIYNREGKNLYSKNETPEKNPKEILEKEFKRELTKDEKDFYFKGLEEVISNMEKRNDPKVNEIKELYKEQEKIKNIVKDPFLEAFKNRQNGLER